MKNLIKILFAILLLAVACKKEDTPAPVVVNGTNGSNGTNATNTSVLYSEWLSPNPNNSGVIHNGGSEGGSGNNGNTLSQNSTAYFNVMATAITQDILDKGAVMAYAKLEGDASVRALPTTTMISGYLSIWNFNLTYKQIQFTQFSGDPNLPAISGKNQFRYIVIPSNKHLRLSKPLKDMTYNEICDMFNIPK